MLFYTLKHNIKAFTTTSLSHRTCGMSVRFGVYSVDAFTDCNHESQYTYMCMCVRYPIANEFILDATSLYYKIKFIHLLLNNGISTGLICSFEVLRCI